MIVHSPDGYGQDRANQPFVLRAHHARQLFQALALGWTDEKIQDDAEKFAARNLPAAYYEDVYGSGKSDAQQFKDHARQFFSDFMKLPDDAPVKIVSNQKDYLCSGCAIGNHCEKRGGDSSWIKGIKVTAKQLELSENLIEGADTVDKNGKTYHETFLELSAGVARSIFAHRNFRSNTFPAPLRPLVRHMDNDGMVV